MENNLKELVCNTIDKNKEKLHKLSQDIWSHPELAYEEVYAHNLLISFLQKEGFKAENKPSLPTSFVLSYGEAGGLHVGFVCEYDALPNIGHACGHNLIAEVGVASALGSFQYSLYLFKAVAECLVFELTVAAFINLVNSKCCYHKETV